MPHIRPLFCAEKQKNGPRFRKAKTGAVPIRIQLFSGWSASVMHNGIDGAQHEQQRKAAREAEEDNGQAEDEAARRHCRAAAEVVRQIATSYAEKYRRGGKGDADQSAYPRAAAQMRQIKRDGVRHKVVVKVQAYPDDEYQNKIPVHQFSAGYGGIVFAVQVYLSLLF